MKINIMDREISRKIITLILMLVFGCGLTALGAVPLYQDLKIVELEIETERENKTVREEFLSRIAKSREINRNVQKEDVEKINRILLSRNGYEDYLSRIIYLAQINNVVVKDFSISQPSAKERTVKIGEFEEPFLKKSPEFREAGISFSALGEFSDFMEFIGDFENMGPLADEESLKIISTRSEKSKKESGENQEQKEGLVLNYEINFIFYY